MKFIKRYGIFLLAAALIAAAAVLGLSAQDTLKGPEAKNVTTLKIWGGVPEDAGPAQVMAAFNKEFETKGLRAEYTYYPNNDSGNKRLETTILAGGDVDAYFTYTTPGLEKRVNGNMALDLSDYIARDNIDLAQYFGPYVTSYFVNGKPYSIPTKLDQYGITINKDMFDKAGIAIPTEWTFDEFREIAKKLSNGTGKDRTYGMFFCTQQDISYIMTYMASRSLGGDPLFKDGGTETNFDSPVIHDVVNLVNNMMNVDHSAPTHIDSVTQKLTQESMFLTGKCAMTIGPWIIRSAKDQTTYPHTFTIAFAPYPVSSKTGQNFSQGGLGDHLSICPNSRNPDAAWEFMKWYAAKGMINMVGGGRIPAYKGFDVQQVTDLLLKGSNGYIDAQTAKDILIVPKSNYAIPSITSNLSQINTIMAKHFENIFTQQETVNEGLAMAQREGDRLLGANPNP